MPSIPLPSIFYSQNSFHRIFESHKSFLKDRAKTKEDYEKIAKEISRNFHYNILALDEFISQALNEPSFEKNQERNRLVYEPWCLMHQTLSSPLNQQVNFPNLYGNIIKYSKELHKKISKINK